MKTIKLIHKKTKKSEEIPITHVEVYLDNGWIKEEPKESKKPEKGDIND